MPLKDLNQEQQKAVTHGEGPLLIVAGAGTGKTTVITERVAWLIDQGLAKSDEILALTFTDKAAGEMEERVDKLLPYGYTDLWVMTFHAFAERILKNHALDIGVANDFKLLDQIGQWLLVRENLDKFNLEYYRPLGNPTKFIHALLKHFSRCKDEEIWPEDYLQYAEGLKIDLDKMESTRGKGKREGVEGSEILRLEEVANAYHIYQQLLLESEALDFGDLINYSLRLFRERPKILGDYRDKFKYILVDEFQDTNWAQYEMVKLLAEPKNNLTVSGDDDQSIFAFRGASMSNILHFKEDYPNSEQIFIKRNYRSSQNILDLAYNFIQLNNPERLEVRLGGKNKLNKKLVADSKERGVIEHLQLADESSEVEAVVNKIIELKNSDKQASWNDFAVLVRANSQAESFLGGLSYAGVPFNYLAAKGLYAKEAVRDILAYLKLLDNYHESLALWRILNLAVIKLAVEDLMEISRFAQKKAYSLYEAINMAGGLRNVGEESKKKLVYIIKKIKEHTKLAREKSIKQVILTFIKDFKYDAYLIEREDEKASIYINSLLKRVDEFERASEDKSVKSFMRQVALELEGGEQGSLPREAEEGPEAVKVMTVHGAKGLEFKYVFVVNMVDKRFPSVERREAIELPDELVKEIIPQGDIHLQEERRLFYVALTRAKRGVWLTSARNYGGKTRKKLSRFIFETGLKSEKEEKQAGQGKLEAAEKALVVPESKKIPYQLPKIFSYSQLKAFETCPYQYYLNFILRIPVAGKAVFSYGKTMHSTLQRFMSLIKQGGAQGDLFGTGKDKKLPGVEELIGIYREAWIDDWYESKEQKEDYKKLGEKSLREFYRELKEKKPQVMELEKGFNFKVGEYTIRGTIDRVDKLDKGVEVIDYKTGSPKSQKTVEKDQLLIYQIAAAEVFGWQIEKLTFHYLDNNSQISFLGSEKEIEKIKEKIQKLINDILATDWRALPSEHKCRYCDFSEVCQFREF